MSYENLLHRKLATVQPSGFNPGALPLSLFPHQAALVRWAIRLGRSAIFADTGLGKSRMQLAWAQAVHAHTGRDVHVHVFASSAEGAVVANLRRKERDAMAMAESLSQETHGAVLESVTGTTRQTNDYSAHKAVRVPTWLEAA